MIIVLAVDDDLMIWVINSHIGLSLINIPWFLISVSSHFCPICLSMGFSIRLLIGIFIICVGCLTLCKRCSPWMRFYLLSFYFFQVVQGLYMALISQREVLMSPVRDWNTKFTPARWTYTLALSQRCRTLISHLTGYFILTVTFIGRTWTKQ